MIIVLAFFLLLNPIKIFALSNGSVGIMPSSDYGARDWFIYNLNPGETASDYVVISNDSDNEQHVTIHAYDSEPSNIGGFALSGPNSDQKGIGIWLIPEETEATLAPGEVKKVKFTISIPKDADVGEHSGAITVQTAPKELKGSSGISIGTRVGARVYETVPGKIIKKAKLVSFTLTDWMDRGYIQLDLAAKNEGNVTVTPMTRLGIGGWGLEERYKIFHDATVLPKGFELMRNTEVNTNWQWKRPYFGRFTFQAIMEYEDENHEMQKIVTETLSIFIVPWKDAAIVGSVVLFFLILIAIFLILRRKKYSGKGWDEYTVKENDNIMSLAKKYAISWKFLTKVNKIKKPYFLEAGETLLVPGAKTDGKRPVKKELPRSGKKNIRDKVLLIVITLLTTVALVLAIVLFIKSMKNTDEVKNEEPVVTQERTVFGGEENPRAGEDNTGATNTSTTTLPLATTTSPAVEAVPPTTTEPTVKILVDKDKIRIAILNGSGITGYAGKIAEILKNDGYKEITSGNADRFDYVDATIFYLEGFKDTAENIQKLLKNEYANFTLKKEDKQDSAIVVILGKK